MGTSYLNNRITQFGFSLIELLVVMVIIGLVVGIAVPTFSGSLKKASIRTEAGRIVSALKSARGNAVSQKRLISLLIEKGELFQVAGRINTLTATEELKPISAVQKISKEVVIFEDGKELHKRVFEFYPTGASSGGLLQILPRGSDVKTAKTGYLITINIINGRAKLSSIAKKEK